MKKKFFATVMTTILVLSLSLTAFAIKGTFGTYTWEMVTKANSSMATRDFVATLRNTSGSSSSTTKYTRARILLSNGNYASWLTTRSATGVGVEDRFNYSIYAGYVGFQSEFWASDNTTKRPQFLPL